MPGCLAPQGRLKADAATLSRARTLATAPLDTLQSVLSCNGALSATWSYDATPHLRQLMRILSRSATVRPQVQHEDEDDDDAALMMCPPASAALLDATASDARECCALDAAFAASAAPAPALPAPGSRAAEAAGACSAAQRECDGATVPLAGAQALGRLALDWQGEEGTQVARVTQVRGLPA